LKWHILFVCFQTTGRLDEDGFSVRPDNPLNSILVTCKTRCSDCLSVLSLVIFYVNISWNVCQNVTLWL